MTSVHFGELLILLIVVDLTTNWESGHVKVNMYDGSGMELNLLHTYIIYSMKYWEPRCVIEVAIPGTIEVIDQLMTSMRA